MAISDSLGTRREIAIEAGTLEFRDRGDGSPLLFLHGFPENGDEFRHLVPELAKRHRCITPDWPWGLHHQPLRPTADLSPPGLVGLIRDFATTLGLDRFTLIGAGGGGTIGQLFASEHPELIDRLVLTTGDSLEHFPARALRGFQLLVRVPPAVWVFVQLGRLRSMRRLWFGLSSRAAADDDRLLRESYVRPLLASAGVRRDLRGAIRQLHSRYSLIAAGRLAVLAKPTLLIWSDGDRFFPLRDAEALAAQWPHARLEVIEHDRTFIAHDVPDAVLPLIQSFTD